MTNISFISLMISICPLPLELTEIFENLYN